MVFEFKVRIDTKEGAKYKSMLFTAQDERALYARILDTYGISKDKVTITNRWEEVGTDQIKKI